MGVEIEDGGFEFGIVIRGKEDEKSEKRIEMDSVNKEMDELRRKDGGRRKVIEEWEFRGNEGKIKNKNWMVEIILKEIEKYRGKLRSKKMKNDMSKRWLWIGEKFKERELIWNKKVIEKDKKVRDEEDEINLMGDEKNGEEKIWVDIFKERKNGMGGLRVERRGGIVGKKKRRLGRKWERNEEEMFME